MKTKLVMLMALAATLAFTNAQTKVSDRPTLLPGDLVPATDLLPLVDISAGVSGSKKMTVDQLFEGWGMTAAGKALAVGVNAAAQRSTLGLGTAATSAATAFEPALGNPGTDGYVLSSTAAGVRSWIAPGMGGGGSGDVVGPASATDNAVVRFDNTTGKLVQNSGVAITDNGTINAVASAAGYPSINLPHGTAPSSPANGDIWTTTAGMYARINGVTVGPLGSGGGSGLTNFTEAVNTSTPNATKPVVSFTATNAATNVDFALIPKGTGSLVAAIANNSASGGNKRGNSSVDWQTTRSAADQIAGADNSVISGGQNNQASGSISTVSGGSGNIASGTFSTVIGGSGNSATGTYSTSLGGASNTIGGESAASLGGANNTATAIQSIVHGNYASDRGNNLRIVHGGGRFSTTGDAQNSSIILRKSTGDATPTVLTTNAISTSAAAIPTLPNNSGYYFTGKIIARNTSTNDIRIWDFSGIIKRGANAASTAFVGTPTVSAGAGDSGGSAWSISLGVDTTYGGISIQVTGVAATSIRWVAVVDTLEVG